MLLLFYTVVLLKRFKGPALVWQVKSFRMPWIIRVISMNLWHGLKCLLCVHMEYD